VLLVTYQARLFDYTQLSDPLPKHPKPRISAQSHTLYLSNFPCGKKMIARIVLWLALAGLVLVASTPVHGVITDTEKTEILNVFNQARRTTVVPAADMKILEWDEGLAKQAQDFTDACERGWRPLKNAYFAYWDRAVDPVGVAKWRTWRMAPFYDYQSGGCINTVQSNATCRHPDNYEAIVIAQSEKVGCGMTTCFPEEGRKANFHACVIGGRRPRGKPWKIGPPCSACPPGFTYCLEGLCSRFPGTPKPSKSPSTSTPSRNPTRYPTRQPTPLPTKFPTRAPTKFPTRAPGTRAPTPRRRRG